jgi:O-antigen/teichoic acid export membrane protein
VSGVNFLTVILLARSLDIESFGFFVVAFTLLQTAGTMQAALITRPHNVLAATREGRAYVDYSTTAAVAQVGLVGALVVLAGVAGAIAYVAGLAHASLVLALAPAVVAWQLQELGRRMLYTEGRLAAAFAADIVAYGGQVAILLLLRAGGVLTATTAILSLAAAFAVGAVAVGALLRPSLRGAPSAAELAENWHFGKWLGVAEIGQWFSTQFYIYLGAAVAGAVASAAIKAGQTLLGPVSVFLTFVTSYLPIVLAREHGSSGSATLVARRSLVVIVPGVLAYCAATAVFAEPLLELVYGAEYGQYVDVVRLFALYYAVLALSTVAVAVLSATNRTREVFVGQTAGAVLSLAFGWLLLREMGPEGAVIGMLLSWSVAMMFFLRALRGSPPRVRQQGAPERG